MVREIVNSPAVKEAAHLKDPKPALDRSWERSNKDRSGRVGIGRRKSQLLSEISQLRINQSGTLLKEKAKKHNKGKEKCMWADHWPSQ